MFRIRCYISLGSHCDSRPEMRRESPRQRCASVTRGQSSSAAESLDSSAIRADLHDPRLGFTPHSSPLQLRLSHLVRAKAAGTASVVAQTTTTTDHFSCVPDPTSGQPRFAAGSRTAHSCARRMPGEQRFCTTEGLGNRLWLPPPPLPYPSRYHEEGNADQCVAAGGMPHRDH